MLSPQIYYNLLVALRPMKLLDMKMQVPEVLKKLSSEYGFGLIDTYNENYGFDVSENIIYIGDRHPSSRVHKIYAKSILKAIKPGIDSDIFSPRINGYLK